MTSADQEIHGPSGVAPGYLHGFSPEEQDRLYRQARFLERGIYARVDLSSQTRLLEVGCGVGAQTEILLERFPQLSIDGVDAAPGQVARARDHFSGRPEASRARFHVADALKLGFASESFDSAFVCWFLEHVQQPVEILREVRRTMEPGGIIYCTEVQNSNFYLHPYSPATLRYWFEFNDQQWTLKGDPFVGAKLGNYLLAAGFLDVQTHVGVEHYDNRSPEQRARFIEYWTALLLSGAPALIEAGKVTLELVDEMKRELESVKNDPDSVFFYAWIQARAQA